MTSGCDYDHHVLSGYRAGYQKALLDLRECIASRDAALRHEKVLSAGSIKNMIQLIDGIVQNLDTWILYGPSGCRVVYNQAEKRFYIKKEE